jgi:hypothetical protein
VARAQLAALPGMPTAQFSPRVTHSR